MLGQRRRRWANVKPALVQCVVFDQNIDTMMLQSRRRRRNIETTLDQCIVLTGKHSTEVDSMLVDCWAIIVDGRPTL